MILAATQRAESGKRIGRSTVRAGCRIVMCPLREPSVECKIDSAAPPP